MTYQIYLMNQCRWTPKENNQFASDIQVFDATSLGSSTGQGEETTFPDIYETKYDLFAHTVSS